MRAKIPNPSHLVLNLLEYLALRVSASGQSPPIPSYYTYAPNRSSAHKTDKTPLSRPKTKAHPIHQKVSKFIQHNFSAHMYACTQNFPLITGFPSHKTARGDNELRYTHWTRAHTHTRYCYYYRQRQVLYRYIPVTDLIPLTTTPTKTKVSPQPKYNETKRVHRRREKAWNQKVVMQERLSTSFFCLSFRNRSVSCFIIMKVHSCTMYEGVGVWDVLYVPS